MALQFPLGRRDDALLLVREIDAALQSEPQSLGPLVHVVDADQIADCVEVSVAGLFNRMAQVHTAMLAETLEEAAVERASAGTEHLALGRDQPLFERRSCDHDLERRPGRVAALNR